MRGERMNLMQLAAPDTLPDDAADRHGDGGKRRHGFAIEVRAPFGHFAQHDRGDRRPVGDETGERRHDAIELARGGNVRRRERLEGGRDAGEGLPQQRAVELALAAEVVVDHRLVDTGAAGDAVDTGAAEAALRELLFGGGENAIRRDAGGTGHRN